MLLFECFETRAQWTRGPGCRVYAMLHNPYTGEALSSLAGPPYQLQDFVGPQSSFAFPLTEGSVRTKVHSLAMSGTVDVVLPDSEYGKPYVIEYWIEAASGVIDRDTDWFHSFEKIPWNNQLGTMADAVPLAIKERTDEIPDSGTLDRYEAFCSLAWDTSIERLGICCWLEKNGAVQTTTTNCSVTIVDSSGTVIVNAVNVPIPSPRSAGEFFGQVLGLTLSPDDTYYATCTITDAGAVTHTSASSPVTWD